MTPLQRAELRCILADLPAAPWRPDIDEGIFTGKFYVGGPSQIEVDPKRSTFVAYGDGYSNEQDCREANALAALVNFAHRLVDQP